MMNLVTLTPANFAFPMYKICFKFFVLNHFVIVFIFGSSAAPIGIFVSSKRPNMPVPALVWQAKWNICSLSPQVKIAIRCFRRGRIIAVFSDAFVRVTTFFWAICLHVMVSAKLLAEYFFITSMRRASRIVHNHLFSNSKKSRILSDGRIIARCEGGFFYRRSFLFG